MITLLMVILIVSVLFVGLVGVRYMKTLTQSLDNNTQETRDLRLTSRTRIAQAKVRNTPVTDTQRLVRLGRDTQAKRVVVGGDPTSPLHTNLSRSVGAVREVRESVGDED